MRRVLSDLVSGITALLLLSVLVKGLTANASACVSWLYSQSCQRLGLNCRRAEDRKPLDSRIIHQAQLQLRSVAPYAYSLSAPGSGPSKTSSVFQSGLVGPLKYSLATHGLPPEWSQRDSKFMYGIVQLITKMQYANGHLLSVGASGLPM